MVKLLWFSHTTQAAALSTGHKKQKAARFNHTAFCLISMNLYLSQFLEYALVANGFVNVTV